MQQTQSMFDNHKKIGMKFPVKSPTSLAAIVSVHVSTHTHNSLFFCTGRRIYLFICCPLRVLSSVWQLNNRVLHTQIRPAILWRLFYLLCPSARTTTAYNTKQNNKKPNLKPRDAIVFFFYYLLVVVTRRVLVHLDSERDGQTERKKFAKPVTNTLGAARA